MFWPVAGSQDLVVSHNRKTVEGIGVVVTDSTAQCRPRVWRFRIEEAAGIQLKSEWIQMFHRRDNERKGFILASDLFHHKHKMNLSICEGDAHKLDELSVAAAGSLATATRLPFTQTEGLCRPIRQPQGQGSASHIEKRHLENWIENNCKKNVASARTMSQCSTRASTPLVPSRPDSPVCDLPLQHSISSCPSAIHCSEGISGASISIGLVSADQAIFRGEMLVRSCYNNPSKVRGLGCVWRSDGLLLSQYLSKDGAPISWTGRTDSFGVNDEPEIRVIPSMLGASTRLFLNGKTIAGFPNDVLHWSKAWKLAVRIHRSRVSLLSEIEEPVANGCQLSLSRPRTASPRTVKRPSSVFRHRDSVVLGTDASRVSQHSIDEEEAEDSLRFRRQLEIFNQNRSSERSLRNERHELELEAHIHGAGRKLAVDSGSEVAKLESLEARVAANRARRLASQAIRA